MENETIQSNPVNDSPAKPSSYRWFFVFITLILVYYRTKQENKLRLMTSKEI